MAKILVVDDSDTDREMIGALLEGEGHDVYFAREGGQALEEIEQAPPDILVTDLFMPEIDGFELVVRLRESNPRLPVILVTSRGSEETATRALREGAASYVPKRELQSALADTVDEVLDAVIQERERFNVMRGMARYEASFVLESHRERFQPLISYLQEHLALLGLCENGQLTRIGVALGEAMINAAEHGNLELDSHLREIDRDAYLEQGRQRREQPPYSERRVRVDATITRDEATFVVRDEGNGFDPTSLPDPTDPKNLLKASGRGIMLMRTFMDEVIFNVIGNEVTLIKRRPEG